MGDASISCPRATLICEHPGEEDVKVYLENVHIEVVTPTATHTDEHGRTSTVSTGLPQLTVTGYATPLPLFTVDSKHLPMPLFTIEGTNGAGIGEKAPEVPLSERPETFGSF